MPSEIERSRDSSPPAPPTAQAEDLLDAALDQLKALGRNIDDNVSHMMAIKKSLSDLREKSPTEPGFVKGASKAIDHSRAALESLQSVSSETNLEEAARSVARTLAILHAFSKAAESKAPPRPTEPIPIPKHIVERRAAPRATIEAEIGFQSDTNFFTGFSEDISTGGLFLATFDLRPIGSRLNVNFTMPGGHFISVDGYVRWVREYNELNPEVTPGMGIQFENLHPQDKEAIDSFIHQRGPLFYDGD
jgi:uncharacterized protein (TIGR02266 family)